MYMYVWFSAMANVEIFSSEEMIDSTLEMPRCILQEKTTSQFCVILYIYYIHLPLKNILADKADESCK